MKLARDLLEKSRNFLLTYSKIFFANHLSMSLIVLEKMGVDINRLEQYFNYYASIYQEVASN
ncbi:MAG: hypothetical protein A3E87_00390 [Gammaproteobacteria bacterium RIFCSPHIGHO2_12_FULL_35_23]|nr:MAG: hypothetical protein A3E87_00390 [Gammaproteobacteria bacterium RIFCSPHIGHO2_12_FULL_35_23]